MYNTLSIREVHELCDFPCPQLIQVGIVGNAARIGEENQVTMRIKTKPSNGNCFFIECCQPLVVKISEARKSAAILRSKPAGR